jgi:hypothetical protein
MPVLSVNVSCTAFVGRSTRRIASLTRTSALSAMLLWQGVIITSEWVEIVAKHLADLPPPLFHLFLHVDAELLQNLFSQKRKKKETRDAIKKPSNAATSKTPCTPTSPMLAAAAAEATVSSTPNMLNFAESPSNSEAPIDKEVTGDKEGATPGAAGDNLTY